VKPERETRNPQPELDGIREPRGSGGRGGVENDLTRKQAKTTHTARNPNPETQESNPETPVKPASDTRSPESGVDGIREPRGSGGGGGVDNDLTRTTKLQSQNPRTQPRSPKVKPETRDQGSMEYVSLGVVAVVAGWTMTSLQPNYEHVGM